MVATKTSGEIIKEYQSFPKYNLEEGEFLKFANFMDKKWVSLDELRKAFDIHSNCKRQPDCCFEELKKRFFAPEVPSSIRVSEKRIKEGFSKEAVNVLQNTRKTRINNTCSVRGKTSCSGVVTRASLASHKTEKKGEI